MRIIIASILLFITILLNRSVWAIDSDEISEDDNFIETSQVCATEVCEEASNSISQYIDANHQPCDNFYKFACGNFGTVRKDITEGTSDSDVKQWNIDGQLEQFLEKTTESELKKKFRPRDSTVFILAKRFFLTCKDSKISETKGIQPIVDLIKKYGGWPVVKGDDWNEETWDLVETIGKMSQDGLNNKAILSIVTESDAQDSSKYTLNIRRPEFEIDKDLLLTNYKPYFDFMVDTAIMFGADESDARIQMAQALYFELELAKITNPSNEIALNDLEYEVTIHQLQTGYPYLDWLKYIRLVLPDDVDIDETEKLFFDFSEYFVRLEFLLKQTRKRVIANFIIWRAVLFSSKYLNEDFYQRRLRFLAEFSNEERSVSSRYDECFALTEEHMAMAINTIFIRLGKRTSELTEAALELVNDVRTEFIDMLREVRWMDRETKNAAIKKAKNMNIFVAQPNNTNHKIEIEKYYDGLRLSKSRFFENILRALRFEEFKKHRKLHQPVQENHLKIHSYAKIVNAFYEGTDNTVYIPAASLGAPDFIADRPYYLNYGALGQTIGHEIAHGFDNSDHGKLIEWPQETEEEFLTRAKCFQRQYSNHSIDGEKTLDENIADNGGVKAAYRAYQNYIDRHGAEILLPRLEYTQQQLFWISTAQSYCSKDITNEEPTDDTHSPSPYRVIGMVQNMPEFARDFKCSPGSNMNPISKCEIW